MARPRLSDAERRRNQVNLSLRDAELSELKRRAGVAGLSVPDYLRRRALQDGLQVPPRRRLGAAEFREAQRLAVNVNQMARAMNAGAPLRPGDRRALERLRDLLGRLLPREAD